MSFHRLLDQLDIKPGVLHSVQQPYCLFGCPGLVGVDADFGGFRRSTHGRQARKIEFRVNANLDF